jgi:aminoglycoside phosphotransferase (APT) family kinase protein
MSEHESKQTPPPREHPIGTAPVDPRRQFDVARLEAWLCAHVPGFRGPLEVREFRGGQSNPTYELKSPSGRYVMRRKPPGQLLASAHAVDREYRVMAALHPTGFPVPRPFGLCEDSEQIGTAFFVMEHVEGRILWDLDLPRFAPDERRAFYDSFVSTLAALHQVDVAAVGLADYGRPGNYFARQIARWSKQFRASQTREVPEVDQLLEWLPAHVPADASSGIVHGDYALNNLIVHPDEPRIAAVIDWELSTLGHPLADLTYHIAARSGPQSRIAGLTDTALRSAGLPTNAELIEAYCAKTGRSGIPDLPFYLAFHYFRSAAIMQGIAGRVRDGTAKGVGAAEYGELVVPLARRGLAQIERA